MAIDTNQQAALAGGNNLLRLQVYEYLRAELRRGNLKPGMFISINQMMRRLHLSRTPLRDALLQLQTEGFVTFLPQRGVRINKLTQRDIQDLYEILGALDSRALLSVFDQLGPPRIEAMARINENMLKNISNEDFNVYWDLNTAFHHTYLDLSLNQPLVNHLIIVRHKLFEFGKKDWSMKMRQMNYDEHVRLIGLIRENDPVAAADFIRDVHCVINY
jgi:DNA-binding GntR family transcriptional regulator